MKLITKEIPKDKQLEAVTRLFLSETKEIFAPYVHKWSKDHDWNKKKYKKFFNFERNELINYLKKNSRLCERHYTESINKRTSGTFITKKDKKFTVGIIDSEGKKNFKEYETLYEATTDYIMLEFGLIVF